MILFTAILAFANDFSQRQTIALERIATALEKIAANNCATNIQNPVELPPCKIRKYLRDFVRAYVLN